MLSRVADALYWMGRYLERAENLTRLLLVTEDLATEIRGFNDKLAQEEWGELLAIFPVELRTTPGNGSESAALTYLSAFLASPTNPYSVLYSMKKARDNARAVREALTLEVFVTLNDAYRALEAAGRRLIEDVPAFRDTLSATHRDLLGIVGAIDHTLSRDHGWCFLKLGESVERLHRAAVVLGVKLRSLGAPGPHKSLPVYYTQWRSVLRGLSSLENYRKTYGARMEPHSVIHFLVFDPTAPRSLRYGASTVKSHLDAISGGDELTPSGRLIGRIAARLRYDDMRVTTVDDAIPLVDEVAAEVAKTHDAIELMYFGT